MTAMGGAAPARATGSRPVGGSLTVQLCGFREGEFAPMSAYKGTISG